MTDQPKTFSELVMQVADETDADIYLYSGPVEQYAEKAFNEVLSKEPRRENVVCLITTFGGSADVAYQIVRAIRRYYPDGDFSLFVHSVCKSAGTLVALGADRIIMSDTAELGPLDVQVLKPGELGEMVSGLTPGKALETLRNEVFESFEFFFLNLRGRSQGQIATRTAAEMAADMAVGCFKPIYEQFDPIRLGENERSVAIARAYGKRIQTQNVKQTSVEQLINGYPSHGFVIDRDEAAELFEVVEAPSEPQLELAELLSELAQEALYGDKPIVRRLPSEKSNHENESDQAAFDGEDQASAETSEGTHDPESGGPSDPTEDGDGLDHETEVSGSEN